MSNASDTALAVARPAIQLLTAVNIAYGLVITALLVFSFTLAGWPERPLGFDIVHMHPWAPTGLRLIVVIGILGAVVMHFILRRLLSVVDTVRVGDPFNMDNARRLHAIAWGALLLEVLRLAVLGIVALVWEPGRLGGFSFVPWLAVLLLFVLAGVFAHGARMRADLEGTV